VAVSTAFEARIDAAVQGEAPPFCPRPRAAARFGDAASGLEGHGRAQAAKRPSTTGRNSTHLAGAATTPIRVGSVPTGTTQGSEPWLGAVP